MEQHILILRILFPSIYKHVRPKDLATNIINGWFHLGDDKFKQYMINNILRILKYNNHQFYNEIEYCLFG